MMHNQFLILDCGPHTFSYVYDATLKNVENMLDAYSMYIMAECIVDFFHCRIK